MAARRLSNLRSNIFSSLLGQGWVALIQLIALPLYIKLLGIEEYGLIAFYVTLQATIQAFDFGLGATLNRELARLGAVPGQARKIHDTVRTIKLSFLGIIVVIGAALYILAPILSGDVIKSDGLAMDTVTHAVQLMVVLLPIQWAAGVCQGGLMGLEKQVLVNGLRVTFATVNTGVALLLLYFVSGTLATFFWWQIIASSVYLLTVFLILHRSLPEAPDVKPTFRMDILRELRGFAAGMGSISIAGIVFAYLDRWILITLADLKTFGYYSVAVVVANALYYVITPIFNALFPRFTVLVAQGQYADLVKLYALGTQFMVGLVIPISIIVSLFSHEILLLWTRNPALAAEAAPIASILVLGTALNGIMNLPFAIQLASGWMRMSLSLVIGLIVVFVPTSIALTMHLGGIGCAVAWFLLNALYFVIGSYVTHRQIQAELVQGWFSRNVLPGVVAAVAVALPIKVFYPEQVTPVSELMIVGIATALAILSACFAGAESRRWILARVASIHTAKSS